MSDKESFICLNCHATVELDPHGRCPKCQSTKLMSQHVFDIIKQVTSKDLVAPMIERPVVTPAKELRWWHFVCGPFETYISNYRCTNLEEARFSVYHDNWPWTARAQEVFIEEPVEELSAEEFNTQLRSGNALKSEYYQGEVNETLDTNQSGEVEAQADGSGSEGESSK